MAPDDNSTISSAMALIDPSGTLVPGTDAYAVIEEMILRWIDECGPEYALRMAEAGVEHLERWRHYL